MAPTFNPGDYVQVRSGMYIRYQSNPDVATTRVMYGQKFVLTEDDSLDRSDIGTHLILLQDVPETPPQADEPSEDDVWGENIDTDELAEQLSGMNVAVAKNYLSNEKWTVAGLQIAAQAEAAGKDREGVKEYINGRISELEAEDEDDGLGDPSDEVDLDEDDES